MIYAFTGFKWYRKWKGGLWYYVRPYDNLYDFQHMRYWINRNPFYNEVIIKHEIHMTSKSTQSTFIFCQKCGVELISNRSCVRDDTLTHFECRHCGNKAEYSFDIAPVPILIRSDFETTEPHSDSGSRI